MDLNVLTHSFPTRRSADLPDLADIDVLDDVAGLRIDGDGPPGAGPAQALHRIDQRIARGVAAGGLHRLVDQVHAVIAADRHEVRPGAAVGRLESLDRQSTRLNSSH